MNTLKKIFAVAAATATMGVMSFATIGASAAEIAYNGPCATALNINNDGATARLNIYNTWGNEVEDISPSQNVIDYIEVTFTISGLGDKSCNVNEDGTPADPYVMSLVGDIGTNSFWDEGVAGTVNITGDGQYTVRTDLAEPADTILCLILSSNINFYQLGENVTTVYDSGLNITVDSIKTGDAEGEGDAGDGSTTTTTTSGDNSGATTTTTTKKNNSGSSSNNSNKNNSSSNSTTSTVTQTADAGVVAIVVGAAAAASLAVGAVTFSKKRK